MGEQRCERCDRPHGAGNAVAREHEGGCACPLCESLCWVWPDCEPVDWRGRALRAEEAVRVAKREVSEIEDVLVMLNAMLKADDQALGDLSDAIGDLRALLCGGWVTNAATHAAISRVLEAHDRWVAVEAAL